jgi:hypothetical protein
MQVKKITVVLLALVLVTGLASGKHYKKIHPKDLNEAIMKLDDAYSDKTKKEIFDMTESEYLAKSHFSTALWIRYNWGLWHETKLSGYFNDLGIYHPSDMAAIIVRCYYRHLHQQDYELDKLIKTYQNRRKKLN